MYLQDITTRSERKRIKNKKKRQTEKQRTRIPFPPEPPQLLPAFSLANPVCHARHDLPLVAVAVPFDAIADQEAAREVPVVLAGPVLPVAQVVGWELVAMRVHDGTDELLIVKRSSAYRCDRVEVAESSGTDGHDLSMIRQ